MLEALSIGLGNVLTLHGFVWLVVGLFVGMLVSVLPGLGGITGICLVLPFVWSADPSAALLLLIGIIAIMRTADSIPAIMMAVPGTASAQAIILDGYPLARQGKASMALGASLTASMVGLLVGTVFMTLSIPVASIVVSLLSSAEFFMLTVLGIAMIGTLSGRQPLRGLAAALLGLLLSTIGSTPGAYQLRFTFGIPYLFSGLGLLPVALGIFALPEIIELLIGGTPIARNRPSLGRDLLAGCIATFRHWFLTLRSCVIGSFFGFLPGIGAGPAAWFAYGHALQTARDKSSFGKGDIRGVLAPDSANSAADVGALMPALFFGIPGSGTAAIFLFALLSLGINPGQELLTTRLDLTFTIVWALAIGGILASLISLILAYPLTFLTQVRIHLLAPFLMIVVLMAAFQSTAHWGDLISLLALAILGWTMKRASWPRPPLLIAFILGPLAERFLWTSISCWGVMWIARPGVIVIALAIIATMVIAFRTAISRPE